MRLLVRLGLFICILYGVNLTHAHAQEKEQISEEIEGQIETTSLNSDLDFNDEQQRLKEYEQFELRIQLQDPQINVENISSLFLSGNEVNLLIDAQNGLFTRPPTEEELRSEQENAKSGQVSRPDSVREIALGGILYKSGSDWAIWLNSQKITPKNMPPAIIDIQVNKDYIRLKWLDFQTNQIFPVKLRANQRFNFDTRMFLPG